MNFDDFGPSPAGLLLVFIFVFIFPFVLLIWIGKLLIKLIIWIVKVINRHQQAKRRKQRHQAMLEHQRYMFQRRCEDAETVLRYKQQKVKEWEEGGCLGPIPYDLTKPPVFRGTIPYNIVK